LAAFLEAAYPFSRSLLPKALEIPIATSGRLVRGGLTVYIGQEMIVCSSILLTYSSVPTSYRLIARPLPHAVIAIG